jgi:hypothetical protein
VADAIGLIGSLGVNELVMFSLRVILRFSNPLVFADVGQLRVTYIYTAAANTIGSLYFI